MSDSNQRLMQGIRRSGRCPHPVTSVLQCDGGTLRNPPGSL